MRKVIVVLGLLLLASTAVSAAMVESRAYTNNSSFVATGDVLWSQLDDPSGSAFTDQGFEAAYAAYDATGADDFVVDAASWDLTELFIPGSVTVPGANPFFINNAFYADAGGVPGAVLCDFTANTSFSSAGDGDITIDVSGCNIPSQTAWVSNQVRQDFNPFGQHYWATRNASNSQEGVWTNPGNGFGNGCLDWQPMNTVCGTTGADWMFELAGSVGGGGGEGVPAIGPFGAVLLIVSLGAGSAYVIRRRRV